MLPKPPACAGCPFEGDGQGFVPDEVPDGCEILFIQQGPGAVEEYQGRPAIGPVGSLLRYRFVPEYLPGRQVGFANLFHCRRGHADALPKIGAKEWLAAKDHCWTAHVAPTRGRAKGALEVWVGAHAISAFYPPYRHQEMLHVRGTFRDGAYLLEHPGVLVPKRSPELAYVFRADFQRIARLVAGWRPPVVPDVMTIIQDVNSLQRWLDGAEWIVLDLETSRRTSDPAAVDTVGLAKSAHEAIAWHAQTPGCTEAFVESLGGRKVIVHYGEGIELPWLLRQGVRVGYPDRPMVHDLHKLHHAADPEADHSLAFVQSLYTWRPFHKHLLAAAETWAAKADYCMMDCLATWEAFMALREVGLRG